ncbi:MAG: sulfatase-like hydrolase/transferase [Planctomycetes bacterium]|nr:sulfatase-like hydrolase/transferase [Planctomycetota bacterium]
MFVLADDQGSVDLGCYSTEERAHFGGGSAGPYRGAKFSLLEGGIRLPAIISWPSTLPRREARNQVAHACDWLPTLAELTGVTPPADLDGRSLSAVLQDRTVPSPHAEHPLHWQVGTGPNASWAVREGDWKLIGRTRDTTDGRVPKDVSMFLADLKTDPGEKTNLAHEHPHIVDRLQELHNRHLE